MGADALQVYVKPRETWRMTFGSGSVGTVGARNWRSRIASIWAPVKLRTSRMLLNGWTLNASPCVIVSIEPGAPVNEMSVRMPPGFIIAIWAPDDRRVRELRVGDEATQLRVARRRADARCGSAPRRSAPTRTAAIGPSTTLYSATALRQVGRLRRRSG